MHFIPFTGLFVLLLIVLVVVILVAATAARSSRRNFRGGNDARNFDDGTTFYPGDAVVNPTSTPPPRHSRESTPVSVQKVAPPADPTAKAEDPTKPGSANVISDGFLEKPDGNVARTKDASGRAGASNDRGAGKAKG